VSLVAENLTTECARDFVDNVSVPNMIFEYAVGWIVLVANVARENFT
jgi:hypothetical protein